MSRKIAALALVAALGSAGVTLCPAGRCPLAQRAAHDCCQKGPGLKALDCCPNVAAVSNAPWLATTQAERPASSEAVLAFVGSALLRSAAPSFSAGVDASARGPAPPTTLLRQHTSLLL